jgi:hypothetical protein
MSPEWILDFRKIANALIEGGLVPKCNTASSISLHKSLR